MKLAPEFGKYRITPETLSNDTIKLALPEVINGATLTGEVFGIWSPERRQAIPYILHKGNNPEKDPVVVYFMQFSDGPRSAYNNMAVILSKMIGKETGRDPSVLVLPSIGIGAVPENSGVGGVNKLTDKQKESLRSGDFGPMSGALSEATASILQENNLGGDVYLLGASMGASVAAAGLTSFGGNIGTDRLMGAVLAEAVGFSPGNPVIRAIQFARAGIHSAGYLELNHPLHQQADMMDLRERSIVERMATKENVLYGLAISRVDTTGDIRRAVRSGQLGGLAFWLVSGRYSEFRTVGTTIYLQELLRNSGMPVGHTILGGHHALASSTGVQVDFTSRLMRPSPIGS